MNTNTHQRRIAFISYRIFFAVNSLSQGYRSAPHCRLCYSGSFLPLAPLLSPTVARNKKSFSPSLPFAVLPVQPAIVCRSNKSTNTFRKQTHCPKWDEKLSTTTLGALCNVHHRDSERGEPWREEGGNEECKTKKRNKNYTPLTYTPLLNSHKHIKFYKLQRQNLNRPEFSVSLAPVRGWRISCGVFFCCCCCCFCTRDCSGVCWLHSCTEMHSLPPVSLLAAATPMYAGAARRTVLGRPSAVGRREQAAIATASSCGDQRP